MLKSCKCSIKLLKCNLVAFTKISINFLSFLCYYFEMKSMKLLKEHNIGITELRMLLLDELLNAKEPMCFDDFTTKANKTTFYRTMEQFLNVKLVNKIELDGKGYYQINNKNSALFVCDICHHTKDLPLPKIDDVNVSSVLVKGVCKDCKGNE